MLIDNYIEKSKIKREITNEDIGTADIVRASNNKLLVPNCSVFNSLEMFFKERSISSWLISQHTSNNPGLGHTE